MKDFGFPPRVLRADAAKFYVGGEQNLKDLCKAGWVKPIREVSRNTSYDRLSLDLAIDRVNLEGWPQAQAT